MNIKFTETEKQELFDKIAAHFYNANFGQLTKSDMELMMFDIYINKMISTYKNDDGAIDYNKCSDYRMSKDLGITQQKIRNLKIKKQLRNPVEYDWKFALAMLIKNSRYDSITHKVTLNIPNPNLYLEIQNFLEEQGAYIELQLNSKILQMRAEYFLELIILLEPENNRNNIIKEIKKSYNETNKNNAVFDEKHVGKSLLNHAIDIATIFSNISSLISPDNYIGTELVKFISGIFNKQ